MSDAGGALGLIIGGMLTGLASWRWVLFVNVPIGLLVAVGALLVLDSQKGVRRGPRRDGVPGGAHRPARQGGRTGHREPDEAGSATEGRSHGRRGGVGAFRRGTRNLRWGSLGVSGDAPCLHGRQPASGGRQPASQGQRREALYLGPRGPLAQMGERRLCTAEVRGSTPLRSTSPSVLRCRLFLHLESHLLRP
jgi:hypothetical protein